ncbi:MAG: enolase C-terminal domain-like protein [Candidatus Poribacteria bacterium]|nr:enolase C-terminal domain-like protein [Candidatus Poribacteria bacterium]
MKIKEVRAIEIELNPQPKTSPRPSTRDKELVMNRPIDRYPKSGTDGDWKRPACIITAEDGTWGFGISLFGTPVASLINTVYAPRLIGENCMAIEKLWDMMVRLSTPFGASGLAGYAVSAVDCALWDLKGKILQRPVYELLGGPQKEKIFCYASGFDQEWYMELGFKATKLFCPYGPEHGMEGLRKLEEMVADARQRIGDNIELMLDAWTAFDVEFTVRLAEVLKPYKLKWIEDYISSEDLVGYQAVRQRIPWQTLASGEHWYLPTVFASAASRRLVDIFQPDVLWCGGITSAMKICHIAQASGITVITHAGMNYPYGQHLAFAMPSITWGERSEGVSLPGVPLEEMVKLPGTAVIQDGYLVPSDAPGFGLEIDQEWIEHVSR